MVNLFTTFYKENNLPRKSELLDCLTLNLECTVIDKIYVWLENLEEIPVISDKIITIPRTSRPRYSDFFKLINDITKIDDINIIANTDIFFKDDFELVKHINLKNRCLALTRWDVKEDMEAEFVGRVDSQDVWVFKGKIKDVTGDFYIGSLGCDNKIAYELQKGGYKLTNPSLTIKIYHLHLTEYRPNLSAYTAEPLPGPYLYIPITTHEGPLMNLINNLLGKTAINKKNNNFLMHRLYESWLKEMIVQKNKDMNQQVTLLLKCFYYKPAFSKKYMKFYVQKLLKPSLKMWFQ